MTDSHVQDRLSAWLDGALPLDVANRVEQHLKSCPECAAARDALAEQDRALKAALTHEPGDEYLESLSRRIEAGLVPAPAPRTRSRGWFAPPLLLRWASAAAVLVAGSIVAYLAYQRGGHTGFERRSTLQENTRVAPARAAAPQSAQGEEGAVAPEPTAMGEMRDETQVAPPSDEKKQLVPKESGSDRLGVLPTSRMREVPSAPKSGAAPPAESPSPLRARSTPPKPTAPVAAAPAPILAPKAKSAQPMSADDRLGRREEGAARNESAPAQPPAPAGAQVENQEERLDMSAERWKLEADSLAAAPTFSATPDVAARASAKDAPAAEVQLCGRVADPSGAPVSGAQVVATNLGRVATADASGRFCLTLPPGRHDLRVLAVGHVSVTRLVIVGAQGATDVAFTMAPVSALGEGLVLGDKAQGKGGMPVDGLQKGAAAEPALSPEQRARQNALKQARSSQERAAGKKTAAAWDGAAGDWEKALRLVEGGDLELEARAAVAECRYRAWKAEPTASRSKLATQALTAYLVRAPVGPARDRAAAWAEELK